MKRHPSLVPRLATVALLAGASLAQAQAPAAPPAGSTAACRDGTYSSESSRDAACAANRGVKEWWGKGGPDTRPAIPATSPNAPVTKTIDGKPLVQVPANQVIADPQTRMYQRCTTSDEHETPIVSDAADAKKPPRPPGDLMSEEQAKAKGFRPGAHKVNCDL